MPVFVTHVGCLVLVPVVTQDQNQCLYPKVSGIGNMQQVQLAHYHVMPTAIHIHRLRLHGGSIRQGTTISCRINSDRPVTISNNRHC